MKLTRWFLLAILPLFLAACGPTAQQQADLAAAQRAGVPPATYDKMVHGDALSLSDIEALSRAHVNDGVTLRYLRDHGTIYSLNTKDVIQLRDAGVSQSVIDYMLQTARALADYYSPYEDPYFGPWGWYGPGYWGPYGYGYGFGFYGGRYGGHYGHGGHHH